MQWQCINQVSESCDSTVGRGSSGNQSVVYRRFESFRSYKTRRHCTPIAIKLEMPPVILTYADGIGRWPCVRAPSSMTVVSKW